MFTTCLQIAVAARIGDRFLREVAPEAGLSIATLSKVRAGRWTPPRGATLDRLASWLGWDAGRVLEAAGEPVNVCEGCGRPLIPESAHSAQE